MRTFLFLVFVFVAVLASARDISKWTDDDGNTQYGDRIPPPTAKNTEKLFSVKEGARADQNNIRQPYESRMAAEKYPLTLYSFEVCGDPCKQAEKLLNKRGVPYTLKSSDEDKAELVKRTGKREAPVLIIGNTTPIAGFEESQWNKELDLAGYAKSNLYAKPGSSTAIKPPPPKAPEVPAEANTGN